MAWTTAGSRSGMGGYELHDQLSEQFFRPAGGYFANFSSSVGSTSEEIYSQQAVYFSYASQCHVGTIGMTMDRSDEVLVALRRVIRAIDLHSKKLAQQHGLTGPQALIVKEVIRQQPVCIGTLAKDISLSHATVTDIVKRLEGKALLSRKRSEKDRRQVLVTATSAAENLMQNSIPLLQEKFTERFDALAKWKQSQIISSLERISNMMDADQIEASPILAIKSPNETSEHT